MYLRDQPRDIHIHEQAYWKLRNPSIYGAFSLVTIVTKPENLTNLKPRIKVDWRRNAITSTHVDIST